MTLHESKLASATNRGIAVMGHICLDMIPDVSECDDGYIRRIDPGRLYRIGPAVCTTGGVVSNTGIALHKLGASVRLVGKVGDDPFGSIVAELLRGHSPTLADGLIVAAGEHTSYSIVISSGSVDRSFLHCPGANDTFCADEVVWDRLEDCRLLHFGYPPLMEQIYRDGGRQLADLFRKARSRGVATSLDMSMPDPSSPAGQVDWPSWLARVLPEIDLFAPSLEETLFMLRRDEFEARSGVFADGTSAAAGGERHDVDLLGSLADRLLELGAGVVVLKLGAGGLFLKSAKRGLSTLLARESHFDEGSATWRGREMIAPCFTVEVAGTTGAGDCTIAGLLAAVVNGAGPAEALVQAAAVGACSVEAADASSGIRPLEEVRQRIAAGWKRRQTPTPPDGWRWDAAGVWRGPNDAMRQ